MKEDQVITAIEESILSLSRLPNRGSMITAGIYANMAARIVLPFSIFRLGKTYKTTWIEWFCIFT